MVPFGKDFFGRPNMVENTVDESTMRKIADIGSGEFFRVTDNRAYVEKKTGGKMNEKLIMALAAAGTLLVLSAALAVMSYFHLGGL